MRRRLHMPAPLRAGAVDLDPRQAHHARDVLRLTEGDAVEVFDDDGAVAPATITRCGERGVVVEVGSVTSPAAGNARLVIASAVPKGERADWMIEKLSELGVERFVPLETARSVVHPAGTSKRQRWQRLATESAKQSRRAGVMRIDDLAGLEQVIADVHACRAAGVRLSLEPQAVPAARAVSEMREALAVHLFIGPEGGWTDRELQAFDAARIAAMRLTRTVLRVETAAIAAAAVVATLLAGDSPGPRG